MTGLSAGHAVFVQEIYGLSSYYEYIQYMFDYLLSVLLSAVNAERHFA